jgi:hypothetical protein
MEIVAVAAMAAVMIGCAPAARAITGNEACDAMKWPMPLPPTVGWPLDHIDGDSILECLDFSATAPDGHDVMNDPARDAHTWRITGMSPPAGTLVARTQTINVTVVRDFNQALP